MTEVRTSYWRTTDDEDAASSAISDGAPTDDSDGDDTVTPGTDAAAAPEADAEPEPEVTKEEAEAAWAPEARRILTRVAGAYQSLIEYAELAAEIQESSGIHTRRQVRSWIVPVLDEVARLNHEHGEPMMTSLVVHKADGTVGTSYDLALSLAGIDPIEDPLAREKHASQSRLDCYQWADANVPSGGGRPEMSPRFQQIQARQRKERRDAEQPNICPHCFMAIPPTGRCDNCG
ncbi:hypothetical protein H5V45_07370 [Nocardioides sp. KIGAM211]|uniref:Uncharacterized protein n=1 Tax=Nocardioides luti TaxID=2761101 RepID=A0A7X0RF24_9ACTN|nr:hypothetical protein [Nocardioides luti]MBB6627138.1 hypothetical protein [Nocardioides luti]